MRILSSKIRSVHLLALLTSLALAIAGCGSGIGEPESKMTSYTANESANGTAQLFTVPRQEMAHIRVVPVEKTRLQRVLRLTGSVAYNQFKTTPVFPAVGGPVHEILVAPGQVVSAGTPLLTVNSPDYSAARSAYIKAKDSLVLADKNFTRAQDLYAHGAIAESDLLAAESARNQAEADMVAAKDALHALGIKDPDFVVKNPGQTTLQIPLLAPVGGEIVERLVGPGQLLQSGATQCFTISDMSEVWVLVNVYQSDLPYVHLGDAVSINTDSYPDVFHGKISYIAPALDPNTRTLQARIVTENPGHKLKKDMYVAASVLAGVNPNALTVPDAAVLRDTENQPYVYVATQNKNQFARRLVKIGDSNAGRTEIASGLKEGEQVVGDGALFLQFKNSLQH
ncbi:MAG TPA: efflux RND transporter periplasmic adaptor subunit [Candidatus Saccharimonadales bacterium]|nr:efflux RND transporter periplasmic adaptor subunit [Candidatus Saccharimonadales bacterium]